MAKLLIAFTDPQEAWLREEAQRLGLPGGVSELVRRAVDTYRGEPKERKMRLRGMTTPELISLIEREGVNGAADTIRNFWVPASAMGWM